MPALAATDVTVTVQTKVITSGSPSRKRNRCKIVFGDGALTYPSGGVPMPAFGKFGLKKFLTYLEFFDTDDALGVIWKYDFENQKLRCYIQGITVSAAGAATVDDFALDATADPLVTAVSLSLTNSTGAGAKYLGKLLELATAAAPPATTLYCAAFGW